MREAATLKISGWDKMDRRERHDLADWLHDQWHRVMIVEDLDDKFTARFYTEESGNDRRRAR